MADQVILIPKDGADPEQAKRIIDAFAERTGLEPTPADDGTSFAIGPDEHGVPIKQTLDDIDAHWAQSVQLGDPAGAPG